MLIPDLRFDFAYGRFIHLFDHNFAQDSFRNEIFKFLKTSKTIKSILREKVIGIVLSNVLIGFGAGLIDTGLTNPTQTGFVGQKTRQGQDSAVRRRQPRPLSKEPEIHGPVRT